MKDGPVIGYYTTIFNYSRNQ